MTTGHQIFTQAQRELLTAALNRIIPAEDKFPGAGDLGLADFVESVVAQNNQLRRLFTEGLAQVEITAAGREGKEFLELDDAARDETLREVEAQHPRLFEALVRQCYNGYYTNPQIFELVDYRRLGPGEYIPKPLEESLLELQRQRAPFWRQV
jgi:Gluconate 2-dehydrogenase subunit 3